MFEKSFCIIKQIHSQARQALKAGYFSPFRNASCFPLHQNRTPETCPFCTTEMKSDIKWTVSDGVIAQSLVIIQA